MLALFGFINDSTCFYFLAFSQFLFCNEYIPRALICFQASKWPLKFLRAPFRKKLPGSSKSGKKSLKNAGRVCLKIKYQVEVQVFSKTFGRILSNFTLFNASKNKKIFFADNFRNAVLVYIPTLSLPRQTYFFNTSL